MQNRESSVVRRRFRSAKQALQLTTMRMHTHADLYTARPTPVARYRAIARSGPLPGIPGNARERRGRISPSETPDHGGMDSGVAIRVNSRNKCRMAQLSEAFPGNRGSR